MTSQPVAIWANFANTSAAGAALTRLERLGFLRSQIAVQKRFRDALSSSFDWSHALYVRLPEGIVAGFAGGAVMAILGALLVGRGAPNLLTLSTFCFLGMFGGAIFGAFAGLLYARYEGWFPPPERELEAESIAIGVQCDSLQSQEKARDAFAESGADTFDGQP